MIRSSLAAPTPAGNQNSLGLQPAQSDDMITKIILRELLTQVEREGQTLEFDNEEKQWVLRKLSEYLFGSEERDIVASLFSTTKSANNARTTNGLARIKRNISSRQNNQMDRFSFSHEYRILVSIGELLRTDPHSQSRDFRTDMENAGK